MSQDAAPMGAGKGKWRVSYTETVKGRGVVVDADTDEVGRKHAHDVAAQLQMEGSAVRVVDFPDLPEKGDVSDRLDKGHTVDNLIDRIDATPPVGAGHADREDCCLARHAVVTLLHYAGVQQVAASRLRRHSQYPTETMALAVQSLSAGE